ncbi:hypothetical protein GCM10022244_34730 [Streptomyces gulbargensis]|uniref:Uncharacterized protein n=1 Tax=Streptomyces gulbargensis TaxID=364901 RepID=A0ABP7MGC6_9ACTN
MSTVSICPRCERDRLHRYRFKSDGAAFSLCTVCDSLWWPQAGTDIANALFLDDVVAARLGEEGNPWATRVWTDVIEAMPDQG